MPAQVRTAATPDVGVICEIVGALGLSWTSKGVSEEVAAGRAHVLEDSTGILGFAFVRVVLDEAELLLIGVRPTAQRQGYGRRLLRALFDLLPGCTVMHLEVAASNASAVSLYTAEGFERVGLRARYYSNGDDAVLMKRNLH